MVQMTENVQKCKEISVMFQNSKKMSKNVSLCNHDTTKMSESSIELDFQSFNFFLSFWIKNIGTLTSWEFSDIFEPDISEIIGHFPEILVITKQKN